MSPPLQPSAPEAASDAVHPEKSDGKKSKAGLYTLIALLLILILAAGGYVVYERYYASEPELENGETEESDESGSEDDDKEDSSGGCIDSNEQCEGQPDGTECTYGVWCDALGRTCGGESCSGMGFGECQDEACVLKDETSEEAETATLNLFFYKSPLYPNYPYDDIEYVERETDEEDHYAYIIRELIAGPTTDELDDDYIPVFSLSGDSTCSGNNFEYSRIGDVLKIKVCKEVEPVMDADDAYAGITLNAQARVIYSFERSLEFGEIGDVALFDKDGDCYAPDTGRNACTYGEMY